MFAGWYYALHLDLNANLRVILKESLRSVPIYGWAMQVMLYIFLSRKREMDIPYIKRMLTYLLCTGPAPSILLFPEGTDLNDSNKKKSNACKCFIVYMICYCFLIEKVKVCIPFLHFFLISFLPFFLTFHSYIYSLQFTFIFHSSFSNLLHTSLSIMRIFTVVMFYILIIDYITYIESSCIE